MNRFDRNESFFGKVGQEKLAAARVAIVGVGGLGTHLVQQLAYMGVREMALIDDEELTETNLNRYIGARSGDPIPGTPKVSIGARICREVDPAIKVTKIQNVLASESAFKAIIGAGYVFGCLDNDGARLILNELCTVYGLPYLDLASEIIPGSPPSYGGRVFVNWDGHSCLVCCGLLDITEAQRDLEEPEARKMRDAIYGVRQEELGKSGPSVVSINGVVASLAVTEFMVGVTGIRAPQRHLTYHGNMGRVSASMEKPKSDCYYCAGLRGKGAEADVERYVRSGGGLRNHT